LSTHILPEVSQLCGRVIILSQGQIAAIDTPEGLTNRLQGAERVFLQVAHWAADIAAQLRAVDGVQEVQDRGDGTFEIQCARERDLRTALAELVVGRGWGLLELRPVGMSLEEIFLKLTTHEDVTE